LSEIIRARAPLRISFAGGGTDVDPYPEMNGGAVISTGIDRYANVSLNLTSKNKISVRSQDYGLLEIFEDISTVSYNGKLDLVKAALKSMDLVDSSFDAIIHVDSPPGSGLGSSSAMTVSLLGALLELMKKKLTPYEIAEKAYQIERIELGIKGGRQDQYAATFGGFNFLEFKKSNVKVTPLKIRNEILNELLASSLVCDTKGRRISAHILERQSKSYESGKKEVLDNLDLIKQSAYEMRKALENGMIKEMGGLLDEGWEHKKKLDSNISNPDIDRIYDKAISLGAVGGRLMGAGGGGHFLFICNPDYKEYVSEGLKKIGCEIVKINFDYDGLQTWKTNDDKVLPNEF